MGGNVNTLRPRQNGRHFADDIFKCIFLNENVWIPIRISLKFVPKGPINNIPALVQIMAWRRSGDKPLFESMMASLLTHICVTRPQWVKDSIYLDPRNTDVILPNMHSSESAFLCQRNAVHAIKYKWKTMLYLIIYVYMEEWYTEHLVTW